MGKIEVQDSVSLEHNVENFCLFIFFDNLFHYSVDNMAM